VARRREDVSNMTGSLFGVGIASAAAASLSLIAVSAMPALAQGTLRIGMTAATFRRPPASPTRASRVSASPATRFTTPW